MIINKRNKILLTMLFFITVCIIVCCTSEASYAFNKTELDSYYKKVVSDDYKLKMTTDNCDITWENVEGKIKDGNNDKKILCIPIKSNDEEWTQNDFMEITFTNIGTVNGRQMDATMKINEITVSERKGSSEGESEDGYMGVAILDSEGLTFGAKISDGCGYRAAKTIKYSVNVFYHDTNEAVALPFFQAVKGLDETDTYYKEGWSADGGYSDDIAIYDTNNLTIEDSKITATEGSTQTKDIDEIMKAGFYVQTESGNFSGCFYSGDSETSFDLFNQYSVLKNPELSQRAWKEDGEYYIEYTIKQNIWSIYLSGVFESEKSETSFTIPEELEYQSTSYSDENWCEENYDETKKTVTYPLSPLGSYVINIKCKLKSGKETSTIKATATSDFGYGFILTSNEKIMNMKDAHTVKFKYVSGTAGVELPSKMVWKEDSSWLTHDVKMESEEYLYFSGDEVKPSDVGGITTKTHAYGVSNSGDVNYNDAWVLSEWSEKKAVVSDSDITFTGTWEQTTSQQVSIVVRNKIKISDIDNSELDGSVNTLIEISGKNTGNKYFWNFSTASKTIPDSDDYDYDYDTYEKMTNDGEYLTIEKEFFVMDDEYTISQLPTLKYNVTSMKAEWQIWNVTDKTNRYKTVAQTTEKNISFAYTEDAYNEISDSLSENERMNDLYVTITTEKTRWDGFTHNSFIFNKTNRELS